MTAPAPPPPPKLLSWWFYTSPIALDDPLSPLPMTTSSTLNQKHPHRPFSHFDTASLEKAYQELLVSQPPPTEYGACPPPPASYSRPPSRLGRNGTNPVTKRRGPVAPKEKATSARQTPLHLRHYSSATVQTEYAEEGRGDERLNAPFSASESSPIKESTYNAPYNNNPPGLILRGRTLGRAGLKIETDEEALMRVLRQDEQSPPQITVDNRRRRRSTSPEMNPWTGNPISPTRESSASPSGSAESSINPAPMITKNPFIRSPSFSRGKTPSSPSPSRTVKRQKSSSLSSTLSTSSQPVSPTSSETAIVKQNEVPVGVQRLYKVLLPALTMTPIFWTPVHDISGVCRATWFYKDTMLPVETDLANRLERGYCEVRAWTEEWEAELESAVQVGREGEEKIRWKLWDMASAGSSPSTRPGTSHAKTEPVEIIGGGRGRYQDSGGLGSISGSKSGTPNYRRSALTNYSGSQTPARTGTPPPSQTPMQANLPSSKSALSLSDVPPSGTAEDSGFSPILATSPTSPAAIPNPNDWVIFANAKEAYICRDSLLGFGNKRPLASIRKGVISGVGMGVVRGFEVTEWDRLNPKHKISKSERLPNGVGTAAVPGMKDDLNKVDELKNEKKSKNGVDIDEAEKDLHHRQEVSDLILVIHGIGQKLSERVESFHFTHAINSFRRLLNMELRNPAVAPHLREKSKGMMILPINWRSNVSFEDGIAPPVGSSSRNIHKNSYSLGDITLQTIPAVRNLIGDVMLDIPYYLSHHKEAMLKAVVDEANRVYGLWKEYNPGWEERGGRVHIMAHSLGSVIALDVLSKQPTRIAEWRNNKEQSRIHREKAAAEAAVAMVSQTIPSACYGCSGRGKRERERKANQRESKADENLYMFDFDVSNLFCVGSPAGFFLLLNRSMLVPRRNRRKPSAPPADDSDLEITAEAGTYGCLAVDNIYNIMHYSDPIAYRLNPTVDTVYAESVKVKPIPTSTSTFLDNISNTLRSVLPLSSSSAMSSSSKSNPPAKIGRLPSTIELETHDFNREEIVEKRMYLLNDNGTIDWFTGSLGALLENQYINMLGAHSSYWTSREFAAFLVLECGRMMGREWTLPNIRAEKKDKI